MGEGCNANLTFIYSLEAHKENFFLRGLLTTILLTRHKRISPMFRFSNILASAEARLSDFGSRDAREALANLPAGSL